MEWGNGRPEGWPEIKRKLLAHLSPAKVTATDEILIEQTADAMLEALKAKGKRVTTYLGGLCVTAEQEKQGDPFYEQIERLPSGTKGTLVFIPEGGSDE